MQNDPDDNDLDDVVRSYDPLDELLCSARWPDPAADPLDNLFRMVEWPDQTADPLDKLLRMAQWPEPAGKSSHDWREQLARWQSRHAAHPATVTPQREFGPARQRRRRRGAWAVAGGAVAAALLVAIILGSMRLARDGSIVEPPINVAKNLPIEAPPPNATVFSDSRRTDAPESLPEAAVPQDGLFPNRQPAVFQDKLAEMTFPVVVQPPRFQPRPLQPPRPVEFFPQMLPDRRQAMAAWWDEDLLGQILVQRQAEPDGDLQKLVEPLLAERAEWEQRLLERLHTLDSERESAAIELLGCIGSEASVPLVLGLSCQPQTHAPAVRTLLKIADPRLLARFALNEPDPDLREEINSALRARGDRQTLVFVLTVQGDYSCLKPGSDSW